MNRSTSEFNCALKRKIVHEVFESCECKYAEEEVKGIYPEIMFFCVTAAVQRKYESARRQWKMEESFRDDIVEINNIRSIIELGGRG